MKKLFLLLTAVLITAACAMAQSKVVSGTVVSAADDEPLAGATVMPIGGGQGTSTDIDGNFSLTVPDKVNELNVSYVGFNTRKVAVSSGKMTIKLESFENSLDEVMVVAYGTAKKSAFTGSATVISNDAIEKTQVTNVLDALSGKVAGLQLSNASGAPGSSSPTIRIRGFSSMNAGNSPLVIVDGAPYTNDINSLNTNDIESMTVLKDAASNALYGARGANGVILITTKRAKLGEAKVTVDAKWGLNTRATQDYDYIKDPGQYYETYYGALYNYARLDKDMRVNPSSGKEENYGGMELSHYDAYVWANQNLTLGNAYGLGYNIYTTPEGQFLVGQNGKLNPQATLGRLVNYGGAQYFMTSDNWLDETYKHSLRQEYNVSVTQGNDKSNFYASVGYLKNDGIIVGKSDFERFTGRLSADVQAKPWLKVGGNFNYSHISMNAMDDEEGSSNATGNIFAAATGIAPIYPLYMRDGNGNIMVDKNGYTRYDYGDGLNGGMKRPYLTNSNAVDAMILDTNKSEGNIFSGTGFFEVRFLKDFKFTSNNSFNLQEVRSTSVTNPYYGAYKKQNGIVSKQHNRNTDYTFQQLLTWNHRFGKHTVDALVGHEYYKTKSYVLYASKSNMFDYENDELANAITKGNATSYTTEYNNEGWIFRGQYEYDGKYFASGSFRRDASSRFHPDHRWGNFWSLGAAWIISKESFLQDVTWLDMLKIKASYGEQGNDNIGNFRYTNTYNIEDASGNPAAVPATLGNEDITWEKNGNFNAGVEFSMFNGRFTGNVEAFYRKTSDMLMYFPLPTSFGYSGYYDNIGDMTNTGVEIELGGTPIKTKNFKWDVNFNLTWYKNKISMLPEERKGMKIYQFEDDYTGKYNEGYSSSNYFYAEGLPMYTFYMKKYAGVDKETGKPLYYYRTKDEAGNEIVATTDDYSRADQFNVGTALAPVYGGFSTSFSYRDFDLSLAFNYQIGGKVYDSGYANLMGSPYSAGKGNNIHADILNAWSPSNPDSDIPRFVYGDQYNNATSDRFITDASYLSLENINFGYTLPTKLVRKAYLSKVRVYLACDNVWVWSKRQGLDPRQSFTGGNNNTYYAPIRTISGGLTVEF